MSPQGERGIRRGSADPSRPGGFRRFVRGRSGAVLLPFVGTLLIVVLWWAATAIFSIDAFLLPSPPTVYQAFTQLGANLISQSVMTLVEVLEGFGLAMVVGFLIALAVTSSLLIERTAYPLLVAVNSVPKVAVAPLLVAWLGFGTMPKVLMVFLICFFPIVISTIAGLASTPSEFVELARSLEAAPWRAYLKVRVPNALPQVFVGLKVAISLAVIGAVIAEFQGGSDSGLGFMITSYSGQGQTAQAFVAIIMLGVLSIVLFYALTALERVLLPWARPASRS
jgi:NitT/TauT family transport system permease protein